MFFGKWGWKSLLIYFWLTRVLSYCKVHKEQGLCVFLWSDKKWMVWTSFSCIKDVVSASLFSVRQGNDFGWTKHLQWYSYCQACYCTSIHWCVVIKAARSALTKANICTEELSREQQKFCEAEVFQVKMIKNVKFVFTTLVFVLQ